MPHDAHVVRPMAGAQARVVLVKDNIQHRVQAVSNVPVAAYGIGKDHRQQKGRRDVIAAFPGGLAVVLKRVLCRGRSVPSASSLLDWLQRFDDPAAPKAVAGSACIPPVTPALQSVWQVNAELLGFIQQHHPRTMATPDMDATLIETHKRDALPCYKGFKAYQPLNCWWAEQGTMLYLGIPRRQ